MLQHITLKLKLFLPHVSVSLHKTNFQKQNFYFSSCHIQMFILLLTTITKFLIKKRIMRNSE